MTATYLSDQISGNYCPVGTIESVPDLPPKECVKGSSLNKINFEKEAAHAV
jgi:hypothetical protein